MNNFSCYRAALVIAVCFLDLLIPANLPAVTVLQYDFEDGTPGERINTGTSAAPGVEDLSGNGYDMWGWASGSSNNSPSFSAQGDAVDGRGLSLVFSGGQDGYTGGGGAINAWSPVTWTIEVSVNLDSLSGWQTIIGRNGTSLGVAQADFYLQKNDINDRFRINFGTVSGERFILDSDFVATAGQWYRLAVVSDGTTVTMYADKLDGHGFQNVGSKAMSGATPADNALAATNYVWTFGRGWYNGSLVDHVMGNLDDIRFSDAALTPSQFLGYSPAYITESDGKTILYTGDTVYTDSYDIVLLKQPAQDVLITVLPPAGIDAGNGSGQSRVLTFTAQDWDQPQTVTVHIADPQAAFQEVETIQHTCQSADAEFNGASIRNVQVTIADDACGVWGYLEADYNFDCTVNLEDFARLGSLWLGIEAPLNLQELAEDWLAGTMQYDEGLFARSIQPSEQPFYVNTAQVENTIDEKVYGHFLEHIYHSANGGLWGELVWNRSFEMTGSSGGAWSIDGTELVQSGPATDVRLTFGDTAWQNYEISLEAQKTGGNEGFLILFRHVDGDNFYWLNLGGWNNSQHAVEKEINGSRGIVSGTSLSGSITQGRWYTIRIVCQNNAYEIFLDNVSLISFTDSSSPHLSGQVGVGTWATQARFRNIQVTRLEDSAVLFSGLPSLPPALFGSQFWTVYGSAQASTTADALNDDFGVLLTASEGSTGIQQSNFSFIPQTYSGSLWMKGSVPAGVKVELMDDTAVLGQAVLSAPTPAWTEYPFQITSSGSTQSGALRISLLGAGSVTIDQVSLMGQDSIATGGYRPDLLEAVEGLRPPIIRWPGGCFASAYFWKDGIGLQSQRHKYPITLWDDQDTNSYGTDEFLRMCERIGAEPLICINTGLLNGTCGVSIPYKLTEEQYLQEALDWMEYCNGSVQTVWGAARAANGHPEPYHVKYWEIDNETWSTGYGGGITNYIAKVNLFVPEMQAKADELGVPIQIIACGGNGLDTAWNQSLINACATLIDYISVHNYDESGEYKSGPAAYDNFLTTLENQIAASNNPEMKIYNSEWNLQTTDWRTGLYAGGILNVYERHGDDFKIGGPALFLRHTSATGWDNAFINFDHTGWFAAPNYMVMKLWHDHFAPNRLLTEGSDTDLNVVSTMTDDGQTLYFRVVNPDAIAKSVEYQIDASFVPESAYMHYIAPGDLYARNTLATPSAVYVQAKVIGFKEQTLRFLMPAYSAGVVTVKTTQPHKTKYLYSSFRNNGEDGLHLAYSDDGLTFTALKGDAPFLSPQVGSNLMRDPSICQGPDGMFHLVWTTGWWDKGIGIAHSANLINWSSQTFLPVMADEPNAKNCWAPEIFYDEATRRFLIFWSTTIDGAFPETYNPADDNNHRLYYVATQDFVTYTDTALFYDPGFNCIDAFIARDGERYVMFLKNETKVPTAEKNIRVAFSDHAAGPWGPASGSISPAWVEGPSAIKIGTQWNLYYDAYTRGRMEGQTSPALEDWTDMTGQLSFPSGTRHGTVFSITKNVLEPLLAL
jgi:alpha-N-arabinofuranosidase